MAAVIDRALLLAELGKWKAHKDVVVHAVAAGLMVRIERGDFDVAAAGPKGPDTDKGAK